ncbi:hypothetical protein Hanom_Chr00s018295g01758071 [Helianthus anomalus]
MMIEMLVFGMSYWWSVYKMLFGTRDPVIRESRDWVEILNTQYWSSSICYTLLVQYLLVITVSLCHGLGWVGHPSFRVWDWGWVWFGLLSIDLFCSGGSQLGWVGVIRVRWVVLTYSSSGSYLVVCFFPFSWSLGLSDVLLSNQTRRMVVRGHLWSLMVCYLSGIDVYPGDIRKDQLGGLSFRCSPIWSPTPMLGTHLGVRNLTNFVLLTMGLGWIEGWDRFAHWSTWFWFQDTHGIGGILVRWGWGSTLSLLLCYLINACCEGPGWDRMKCIICNSRIKGYLYSGAMCLEHWFQTYKVVLLINLCKGPLLWGRSLDLAAIHGTEKSWLQQGVLLYYTLRSSSLYNKRRSISVISQQYKAKLLWSAILYKYDRLLDWLLQNSSWIKVLLSPWIGPMSTLFQIQYPTIGGNNFSELNWSHLCSRFFYMERGILVMLQSINVKKLCYASLCNYTKSLEWLLQDKSCVDVLRGLWSGFECSSFQLLSAVFGYCKPSELKFVWYPSVWSGHVRQHLHRFSHKRPGLAGSYSVCCGPGLCTTTYGVTAQYTDPSMIWSCLKIVEIKAQFGLFWVMYRLICDYAAITNKGIFGLNGEDIGHHCMGWQRLKVKTEVGTSDTDFCGPPPVYGPPWSCVFLGWA